MRFRVINTRTGPSADPANLGETVVHVTYVNDRGVPDYVEVPADGFTEEALKAAVKANEERKGRLPGATFEI